MGADGDEAARSIELRVPSSLIRSLRETARLLYDATRESLQYALRGSAHGGVAKEIDLHQERLADTEALLGQLHPSREAAPSDLPITGRYDLLHDVVYGALIDAAERLAVTSDDAWRQPPLRPLIPVFANQVLALDALLRYMERRAEASR
jgi:hypothetical protein